MCPLSEISGPEIFEISRFAYFFVLGLGSFLGLFVFTRFGGGGV